MCNLPIVFCEKLHQSPEVTVEDLFSIIDEALIDPFGGLISSGPSRTAALNSLSAREKYTLHIVSQISHKQHRYCVITPNGGGSPTFIGLYGESISTNIATDLENLVFWAILDPLHINKFEWDETNPDSPILKWRKTVAGHAIVAIPKTEDQPNKLQLVAAIFGLSHDNLNPPSTPDPFFSNATNFRLAMDLDDYTPTKTRLLFEAATTSHPKWRCLSLYRILENAYLTHVKQALLDEFDLDASKAVDNARNSLSSELNQLINLTEKLDLINEFIDFNNEIETLIASGNRFTIRLDRGAQKEKHYTSPDVYKKAVLRFYKLRCAIAHAGTSSVIYEQFQDANSAALHLIPSIERIIFKSLRIVL